MTVNTGNSIEARADEMNARFLGESLADHGRDLERVHGFKDEADERSHLLDVIGMLHKNMHNVHAPSGLHNDLSIEELRKVYAEYGKANEDHMTEQYAVQAKTVADFEAEIASAMAEHKIDRDTAIRWDIDARGLADDVANYGLDYYGDERGLPYGYFPSSPKL